jgi:hypothetical protein
VGIPKFLAWIEKPPFKQRGCRRHSVRESPDIDARSIPEYSDGQFTRLRIPELRIYDLVVLDP